MKVTRILYSHKLNQGKLEQLQEQARLLGLVRSEVWQRFGSVSGVKLRDRQIRDQWMKEKREFAVSARACLSFVAVPAGGYFLLWQGGKFK